MDTLILREVFQQASILNHFLSGRTPLPDVNNEFVPGLFLLARSRDTSKPDYAYRNTLQATVDGWNTWADVVDGTLTGLGEHFLEGAGGPRIHVRHERFAEWQHLLADVSPLAIVSARLLEQHGPPPRQGGLRPITDYVHESIYPQIRYSALPTVYDPRLDRIVESMGMDDLHVHLNGASEMEIVWLEALSQPTSFARAFLKSKGNPDVREFLAQMEPGLTHEMVVARLRVAQRVHRVLARLTLPPLIGDAIPDSLQNFALWRIIALDSVDPEATQMIARWPHQESMHPVRAILGPLDKAPILAMEALLFVAVLDSMRRRTHPAIDKLAYVYLCLMVQFGRLIVQGRNQIGFDQFQKITFNEMREDLEGRKYKERLHQLQSSQSGDLDVLEFRIAPKNTPTDNLNLLRNIDKAYGEYRNEAGFALRYRLSDAFRVRTSGLSLLEGFATPPFDQVTNRHSLHRQLNVTIVAHFIKRRDKREVSACRHYLLRRQIAKQRRALLAALRLPEAIDMKTRIVGFDAASNELHAPPEVFAPLFRRLRRDGYTNFTFHVGEDFVHLASGIRAIVEASEFLDMTPGNRIGHGTAIGVAPRMWRERMGSTTTIALGEWLDDLVFARAVLIRMGKSHLCHLLDEQIASLVSRMYRAWHPPDLLFRAWQMRSLDPLIVFRLDGHLEDTLDDGTRAEFDRCRKESTRDNSAFCLLEEYHSNDVVGRGNEWIKVVYQETKIRSTLGRNELNDPLTPEVLSILQQYALDLLERRRLILETLPTSNVRIHLYADYHEHHLFRWLGFGGSPVKIPIVVGTDDPGIFATCIRNEYTHILRELDDLCTNTTPRPEHILESLIRNSKTWRFQPQPMRPSQATFGPGRRGSTRDN